MDGLKRSERNEAATEVQRNWDDWPEWERSERQKHTILRDLTPKMRFHRLQERFDLALHEHRFEGVQTKG